MKLFNAIVSISVAAAHAAQLAHAKEGIPASSGPGLRGAAALALATSSPSDPPELHPYHYKFSELKPKQLASGLLKIAPKELGWNMQFAKVEFDVGGVRDLHW